MSYSQNQNPNQYQTQNQTISGRTLITYQPTSANPSLSPSLDPTIDFANRNAYLATIGYRHLPPRSYAKLTKLELTDQVLHLQNFIHDQNLALAREEEIRAGLIEREGAMIRTMRGREERVRGREIEVRRREEEVEWREEEAERREEKVEEREEKVEGRGEDLEWGFEQVEGVLMEGAEKGVVLAGAVVEMGILEREREGRDV